MHKLTIASHRRCGTCGSRGHNRRTCPENYNPDAPKRKTSCGWCTELGHNARTCPNKKGSAAKLAELQPLLEEHVSNTLLKLGIGRGTLMHITGYDGDKGHAIVTGFTLPKQTYYGGVNIFYGDEPQINIVYPNGTKETAWLSGITSAQIGEIVSTLSEEDKPHAIDSLRCWGYSSHTVVCKSSIPVKLTHNLSVKRGQTLCGLKEWKEKLTAHLANVKKSEDSEKTAKAA